MEIVKKASAKFMFRCLKTFRWANHQTDIGEIIELTEPTATSLVSFHKVTPVDLSPVGEYIALAPFSLPGKSEKFSCQKLERIFIKAEDALPLMLQRAILPADPNRWRPYGMKIREGRDRSAQRKAALDKAVLDTKLFDLGIHPAQTKK
jgi:hypothetical protein